MISEGLIQQAKSETEHYKAIAERQYRDLMKEEAMLQPFESGQMQARAKEQTRDAKEIEWRTQQRAMDAEGQRMAQQIHELSARL